MEKIRLLSVVLLFYKMDEMNENLLDRHYKMQLRMMSDVYTLCLSQEDFRIGSRWLEWFARAPREQKYARNCLMMLMYSQLKELGKLSGPFTKLYNAPRPLDEVLEGLQNPDKAERKVEEQGELNEELQEQQLLLKLEHLKELQQKQKMEHVPALDLDNNTSDCCDTYNGGSSHENETQPSCSSSNYNRVTERNQQLMEEISQLHARTVQNEQRLRDAGTHWQHKVKQSQVLTPMHPQRGQALLIKIERGTQLAIRRLKDWSAANGQLNFLATCWQDVLADEPESRTQLLHLDRKLEGVLDNLLEQAGERREKNVRILYDQLFEQQQASFLAKQDALRQEEQTLDEARQKLQRQLHDLRHREHQFWQQQHMVQNYDEDRSDRERDEDRNYRERDEDCSSLQYDPLCNCKSCDSILSTTASSCVCTAGSVQHNTRQSRAAGGGGLFPDEHCSSHC